MYVNVDDVMLCKTNWIAIPWLLNWWMTSPALHMRLSSKIIQKVQLIQNASAGSDANGLAGWFDSSASQAALITSMGVLFR